MMFKQFYLESLGHASYLVGSEKTGEALILDPRRDVEVYFAEARAHQLRIRYAADTHQHNDYVAASANSARALQLSFSPVRGAKWATRRAASTTARSWKWVRSCLRSCTHQAIRRS